MSCGDKVSKQPANRKGFMIIEDELKKKFGVNAYYTDLTISYDKSMGNLIGVTVTKAPESLKMGQWNLMQGNWKQNSEIYLEVPKGNKAADFMFQLNEKINLPTLGELVEKAKKELKNQKSIENVELDIAFIKFPKNGKIFKTEYYVILEPKNGGTIFKFRYTIDKELIEMNY
ncbi:hypothetical protein DS884_01040 [Tenacibaculum sp. E3R01]|nr:hypothetical protein DS884_01040 [Tenacibaculum sp. E3R01]